MGEFLPPPPLFLSPLLSFCFFPSNIEIIFDFSDIITKIHPPIQNPGSALAQNPFPDFGFKNPILDFLKETHPVYQT